MTMLDVIRAFWTEQSLSQTLIIIFFTCGVGLFLGKLRLGKFALAGAGGDEFIVAFEYSTQ